MHWSPTCLQFHCHVIRIPSVDRRTDRASQPNCRATTPRSLQGRNLQVGLASARPEVCLQECYSRRYWTDAIFPLLWTPPDRHRTDHTITCGS
ncbi:hypothetical protein CLOM_g10152 [Closterium sp. NIES-68]|nr:hypothetical protein CLOM_g10152 [Closterium sp. NIES-68]GJP83620.1 hypothetical protein CLOP_g13749 [Closterium sp. NIES-67]